MQRYLHFGILILLFSSLTAQEEFILERTFPVVSIDKSELPLAWTGGLNNPQPHMADLDGDGDTELYIFDRQGHLHLGFQRDTDGSFTHEPELTEFFPTNIPHWILLRDFDDDGIVDIFGHSDTLVSGILVYKGKREPDGRLSFDRLTFGDPLPILYFPLSNGSRTQIFVSTIDYPAIDDVDCDGDLDILTFNIGGGYVEFFQNQSIERGYGRDSLIFEMADNCYGGIYESGLSPEVTLVGSPDECATPFQGPGGTVEGRHAGSTLLTFDNNEDGIKELILGDVSFTELVLLNNAGDCEDAWFNDQELDYPQTDVPVDIVFFPAGFYTDLDQDGTSDLIAAPNQLLNAEDRKVFWFYHNAGTEDAPQPELVDSLFLVKDMIDMGTGSIPVAFDVNDDGKQDLVVANRGLFTSSLSFTDSRLVVFLNVGTVTEPRFEQTEVDYLGMSAFLSTTTEFAPAFGDLNGDGRPDAIVGGQSGQLFFFPNTSAEGEPHTFGPAIYPYMDIDAGQSARPQIVDLNRDGVNDLVIGSRSGRINYYQNMGTATNPLFDPIVANAPNQLQLGGIDTRDIGSSTGYATPVVIDRDGEYLLITGTNRGQLEAYGDIENNLDGDFTLLDANVGDFRAGFRSELTYSDFNADGLVDLILGNGRGGLEYFSTEIESEGTNSVSNNTAANSRMIIYPNPANERLTVTVEGKLTGGELQLLDLRGRVLQTEFITAGYQNVTLATTALPDGVYLIRYNNGRKVLSTKVVVSH